MQHFSAEQVRTDLLNTIDSLFAHRDDFLVNPLSDFTRTKKISFNQTMLFPMIAGSDNVATELLDFFGEEKLPLPSAMTQRRNQVKPEAFRELFFLFTNRFPVQKTFHGYQLVACDGSRLNLPYNPSDPDSFIRCISGRKGINQMHLNSLYDLLNDIFLDVELQGIRQMDEKGAFTRFLDKNAQSDRKRIYIADRGYASYNILAHAIHNGQLFLVRIPESFAEHLCSRENWLEGSNRDEVISIHIGRRRSRKLLQLENYHCIPASRHYDFLEAGSCETDCLQLRVLKFPVSEDTFEYIVTNLPAYGFSLTTIKELYNLRWNHETAYRHLKYAGNMVHIHSLKKNFLIQEIFGKLTLYNFSSLIAAAVGNIQKITDKYTYVLNHTQVQKACIRFLRGIIHDISALLRKFLVPVRPGRRFERNLRRQSADTLTYR
ncbi:MAG: IS4 family transposase [Firmicutes bacterium]|nr:IS4 family transposase [Bacillota bacterium]